MNKKTEYDALLEYIKHHTQPLRQNIKKNKIIDINNDNKLDFNLDKINIDFKNKLKSEYLFENSDYNLIDDVIFCLRKLYFKKMNLEINDDHIQNEFQKNINNFINNFFNNIYKFDEFNKIIINDKYKIKTNIDFINNNSLIKIILLNNNDFENNFFIENNFNKLNVDAYLLNSEYEYNINNLIFIYIIFNENFNIKIKNRKLNKDLAKNYLNKSLFLNKCVLNKELNLIDFLLKDECKNCIYFNLCNTTKKDKNKEQRKTKFLL